MRDDTREHTRPPEVAVPGKRVAISAQQSLLLPPLTGKRTGYSRLVIHFHGPSWLPEHAAHRNFPDAAILTVQSNGPNGSDAYRDLLIPATKFPEMLAAVAQAAGVESFPSVVLTSFSEGYGAVREILRERSNWPAIQAVILADSMHASYGEEEKDVGPFVEFARGAGPAKRFLITHSEVYPGTYASTTETASYLLRELGLKRKPVLEWGPLGMQQLSAASKDGLVVMGFAGNSAPDHMDHFFALEEWMRRVASPAAKAPAGRKKR
jgi:hypothetical protein